MDERDLLHCQASSSEMLSRPLNNTYRLDKIPFLLYILKLNIHHKHPLLVYKTKAYIVSRIKGVYVCISSFREMLLEAALPWNTLPFRTAWPTFLAVVSPCQLS